MRKNPYQVRVPRQHPSLRKTASRSAQRNLPRPLTLLPRTQPSTSLHAAHQATHSARFRTAIYTPAAALGVPIQARLNKADMSAPFEYQGLRCQGIAALWNAYAALYADVLPSDTTLVFRNNDLLFRWPEVMATLRRWLEVPAGVVVQEALRAVSAASDEDPTSRNLEQAKAFYAEPANRVIGLSGVERAHLRDMLDPQLMARWGYKHPPAPHIPTPAELGTPQVGGGLW